MAALLFLLLFSNALGAFARSLWSSSPAQAANIITQAYPVGNGRLGVMPFGSPGTDVLNFNVDSLWSGGPFQADNYTGGNPATEKYDALPGIRSFIFQNGTGNVDALLGTENGYGSYQVLGNLSVTLKGISSVTAFNRSLDFETGLHTTTYSSNGSTYTSTVYCSYPDQVCVYTLSSTSFLPDITVGIDNELVDSNTKNVTCGKGFARLTGVTQLGPPIGMKYESIARIVGNVGTVCDNSTQELLIPSSFNRKTLSLVMGAGTDYDQTRGNQANDFSFKGADPGPYVESITSEAAAKSESALRSAHVADYSALAKQFTLSLPDTTQSANQETSSLLEAYNIDGTSNPYLEATLFDYGRHLFISSSRNNSLPPNLQGRWATDLSNAWSADYHANINLQMNHWGVSETGLGSLQAALWNYMADTWVPRGQQTAQLLYGSNGSSGAWVVHDEINIFGHTAMKESAQWANYPASAAWMMQHVYDYWEYEQDDAWLAGQGYPLMAGVAEFWLGQLQEDQFFNDSSLVVNPCNSPEHGPTTFGCTHYQQLLHQLFTTILLATPHVPSTPAVSSLASRISAVLPSLDKGLHIGSFNEIKEWKLPSSYNYDTPNDTHRHLSQLVGWYPGYSLSSFQHGLTNSTITSAVATTLTNRGLGSGPDANSGWEKVWRGACWARLNNSELAYKELRFAIQENFAGNGFSLYSGGQPPGGPFQIDANFGVVGHVLAMLVTDLPLGLEEDGGATKTVLLGPAIPPEWGGGSVAGLRVRGGGVLSFGWDAEGSVTSASISGRTAPLVVVNKARTELVRI